MSDPFGNPAPYGYDYGYLPTNTSGGGGDYKFEFPKFSLDTSGFESLNNEISDFVLSGIDAKDVLATLSGIAEFGIGWMEAQGGMDAARQKLADMLAGYQRDLKFAEEYGEAKGEAMQEAYAQIVKYAKENFGMNEDKINQMLTEAMDENIAAEGETQRQATERVLATHLQGAVSQGQQAAKTAQSGVRNTGSARNLITENTRMFNVDIEEIDRQLAVQEAGYARQRDKNRAGATSARRSNKASLEQNIGMAQTGFEESMLNLTGKNIDFSSYYSGDESFLEVMGENWFKNTILTNPIKSAITGVQSSQVALEEQWKSSIYSVPEDVFTVIGNTLVDIWDAIF